MPVVTTLASTALWLAAIVVLLSQCRKPRWWPGRLFLWIMNLRHAAVTRWGLSHVAIKKQFTILDVGCGGGRTIRALAGEASEGTVHGIDYSKTSVAAATRLNAHSIASGRVSVQHGSVSHLPFDDGTFDLVSAVETLYYWPEPLSDMREILRVLKPGGQLVVIAETYKGEHFGDLSAPVMKMLRGRCSSVSEHRELFSSAGFSEVAIHEESKCGWLCGVGRKPLASTV